MILRGTCFSLYPYRSGALRLDLLQEVEHVQLFLGLLEIGPSLYLAIRSTIRGIASGRSVAWIM